MVNMQSLIHPYIISQKSKYVVTGLCIFTISSVARTLPMLGHSMGTLLLSEFLCQVQKY